MIQISSEKPACYERLRKEFGISWDSGIIITYGGVIYCKKGSMPADFLAHELVHVKQQMNQDPDEYLEKFISEPAFRKWSEMGAYSVQAAFLDATIVDPFDLVDKKTRLLENMLKNYGGVFTREEARDILGLL